MSFKQQIKIPATYMRGGTSKGVFFNLLDLPAAAQVPGASSAFPGLGIQSLINN